MEVLFSIILFLIITFITKIDKKKLWKRPNIYSIVLQYYFDNFKHLGKIHIKHEMWKSDAVVYTVL